MSDEPIKDNSDMPDEEDQGKTLFDFLDKFDAEDYKVFFSQFKEMAMETRRARLVERKTLSWPVFGLIAVIFLAVTVLAWIGRIEGHYVTSFGGIIVGYMLSFLEVSFTPIKTN